MDRAAVRICEAHGDDRTAAPVGDEARLRCDDLGARRGVRVPDLPGQGFDERASGVVDLGGQHVAALVERQAPPAADNHTGSALQVAVEGERRGGRSVDKDRDLLPRLVLHHEALRRRTRVVSRRREQDFGPGLLPVQPVGLGARRPRVIDRLR